MYSGLIASVVPTVLVVTVLAIGAAVAASRPAPGPWKSLAIAGLAVLAAARIVGLVPMVLVNAGPGSMARMSALFMLAGIAGTILGVIGTLLLIAAAVSGRGEQTP